MSIVMSLPIASALSNRSKIQRQTGCPIL